MGRGKNALALRRDRTETAMKLAIIGASRGIGRAAVDYALTRGHQVRAMVTLPSLPLSKYSSLACR